MDTLTLTDLSRSGSLANEGPEAELKRIQWALVELAIEYLRANQFATYVDTARLFAIGVHQLRARVNYRYGSLGAMRLGWVMVMRRNGVGLVTIKCVSCGAAARVRDGLRLCGECNSGAW